MRMIRNASTPFRGRQLSSAASLFTILLLATNVASAIQFPTFSLRRSDCVTVSELCWHTNYESACDEARAEKKMLLVNFLPNDSSAEQRGLEKFLHENEAVRKQLADYVLVRVRRDDRPVGLGLGLLRKNRTAVIDDPKFAYLKQKPGLAIVDYKNAKEPFYGQMVTALPFPNGKYYRWENSYLTTALTLPAGTITQRTMVWAVRIHPEHPRSTEGAMHPELAAGATKQSAYQAQIGVQGHHNWETRVHHLVSSTHASGASEVVAESWPSQGMIDSCIDCVLSWRHSPGHWSAVSGTHKFYGYDIRKGSNGIWYGTGIFAN
ncbi:MAG: hypothetical protein AB7G28_20015 [Pirellulales bacterium]